jgi:hypothetical protein
MVVAGRDQVFAVLDKEIGPAFEPVVVDRVRVAGEQILDPGSRPDVDNGRHCDAR